MKNLYFVFMLFALASCATQGRYEEKLESMIGLSEDDLIQKWGQPQKKINVSTRIKYFSYTSASSVEHPASGPQFESLQYGAQIRYSEGTPDLSYELTCQTRFKITDGFIEGWHITGNDCTSE